MTKQERQRKYNKTFAEKHPDYVKKRLNEKYRMSEEFREQAKYRQMKNYWKRQGYKYEVQILPLTDFDTNADEVKLTRNDNSWIVEIKTKINNK